MVSLTICFRSCDRQNSERNHQEQCQEGFQTGDGEKRLEMTVPAFTDHILRQGTALVRAIEALGTIAPSGPSERALARRLLAAYKRRLRGIAEAAPA